MNNESSFIINVCKFTSFIRQRKIKTIKFYFSAFFLIKILVFEVFFLSLNEFT